MEAPKQLSAESQSIFREGIGLVLSHWSALRMAVENGWGGRDSRSKAEQLGSDIFSWFSQSKEPLYIDDLENMLDEGIESAFDAILDDGSIEEVAEKLMIMHEECLDGNFSSIGSLRETGRKRVAHPHVRQVVNEDDDDDSEDDNNDIRDVNRASNDSSEMMIDAPQSVSNMIPTNVPVAEPTPKVETEDGWTVVGRRRNSRGKRN